MGREIKFRAWDENQKEIYAEDITMIDFANNWLWVAQEDGCDNNINLNNIELMQYTGLKDKNGVEIYEGDIIRRDFEYGHDIFDKDTLGYVDSNIESGYFIGVVSFQPSNGFILNKCKKYNDDDKCVAKRSGVKIYSQYSKIIGNIYENPELLKEEK